MAYAHVAGPSAAGIANPAMPARLRSPLLGEIEGEEPVHAVDPFQLYLATLVELDAVTGDEVVHDVRHQHFSAEGVADDARRIVDGRAEEVVVFAKGVAGVDSDPDANRRRSSANALAISR